MSIINANKYTILSNSPEFIIVINFANKVSRPIAYYAVGLPRHGTVQSIPQSKHTETGELTDRSFSFESPCGIYHDRLKYALLEVPCHSDRDSNKDIADRYHNIYEMKTKKNNGAFSYLDNPIEKIFDFLKSDKRVVAYRVVEEAYVFKGYDSEGNDILEKIKSVNNNINEEESEEGSDSVSYIEDTYEMDFPELNEGLQRTLTTSY